MRIAIGILNAEIERLQLQAQVWQSETEIMLDSIGVQPGWSCIDIGCGPAGILEPLSRRVGPSGRVVGIEPDECLLAAAATLVGEKELSNVELLRGDARDAKLSGETFDLVHERFVLPHLKSPETLLRDMLALARSRGFIGVQELDLRSMAFCPPSPKWPRLKQIIEMMFALDGDVNVGRRVHIMLRGAGLNSLTIRAVVQAFENNHPYARWPIAGINAMRKEITTAGIASASELNDLLTDFEQRVSDPDTYQISFTLVQVCGQKPRRL